MLRWKVNKYKFLQKSLIAFGDGVRFDSQQIYIDDIKRLAEKHKVDSILKYVYFDPSVQQLCEKNINNHFRRLFDCTGVFSKCDENEIPYAVIKGAYLEKIAYMNKGVRASNDLDLLIRKRDYKRVSEILVSEGFVCMSLDWKTGKYVELSDRARLLYNHLFSHQSCSFFKYHGKDEYTKVDINFSITWGEDSRGVSMSEELLLGHVRKVNYRDIVFNVFEPAAFLFQISLHSYRDMNSILLQKREKYKLARLCDVYYYIINKEEAIDKSAFVKLVKEYSYEESIYYILYYVSKFFGSNSWIDTVMNEIEPNDKVFLNQFGLSEDEKKVWPIGFKERILSEHLYDRIESLIDENDLKKINSIENNM